MVSIDLPHTAEMGALQLHVAARSSNTENDEDWLMLEINDDSNKAHYARLSMTARNSTNEASTAKDSQVAALPAGGMPRELMSNTQISLMGYNDDDKQTAILSYGGVPGDGRIAHYGGRYMQPDKVKRLTLRTKSGAPIVAGSVFSVWIGGSPTQEGEVVESSESTTRVTLALASILVVILMFIIARKFKPSTN